MRGDIPLTVSEDRKLPPERFENAGQLRELCTEMVRADEKRMWLRQRVDNLVNGFAAYPRRALNEKGFGWMPRVNYLESEGQIQAVQTPLFDLISEVDHCMEIDLDLEAESQEQRDDWENSIQIEYTWLLFKRWRKSFNYHLPLSQREMLVHGMGYHVWPHQNRWIPRTPRQGEILFPEACSLDFEEHGKYFMLRAFVPGEDVYAFVRNEDSASKLGWEPDNVWKSLIFAQKQNDRTRISTANYLDEIQRRYRRGDIGYSQASQSGIWFNWVFVAEYEGGISLYAIDENYSCGNKGKGYLFHKRFLFDSWPLVMFNYDVGNGDIQSVRGLGVRSKDFFELSNRMKNAMVAQVLISAFPQVKQLVPNLDPDKLKLMRVGAMSLLPYGVDYGLMQFPALNNTGLALSRELKETLQNNNQSMGMGSPEPKDRETAYSFQVRSQDQARVSNGMQSLYESNYQQFHDKMYRLLIKTPKGSQPYQKMAEEFRERCRKRGVPDEALRENAIGEIREVTSTGAGSAAQRLHALMTLMQVVFPNTTEDRKITIIRSITSALMGNANVDKFAPSVTETDLPSQDDSLAQQESNGLSMGGDAIVGARQNDVKHADNHLKKAIQIIQAVEAGQMAPEMALNALQKLLDHAGQHLDRLQGNRQRQAEFKQLSEQWKEIAAYAQKLQNEIQSNQGQPSSPEQQLSEDGAIKMAKVNQDSQIKSRKAEADMALKFRKASFQERLLDAKTASSISRNGSR